MDSFCSNTTLFIPSWFPLHLSFLTLAQIESVDYLLEELTAQQCSLLARLTFLVRPTGCSKPTIYGTREASFELLRRLMSERSKLQLHIHLPSERTRKKEADIMHTWSSRCTICMEYASSPNFWEHRSNFYPCQWWSVARWSALKGLIEYISARFSRCFPHH